MLIQILTLNLQNFTADGSPKLITFELRNSNGVVIDDTTHFVSSGNQTLELNFEVPISNDLQLGLSSGNSGLYRNDQGSFLSI